MKLPKKSLENYESLYENGAFQAERLIDRREIKTRVEAGPAEAQESLSKLSYAEIIAINVYTSGMYGPINDVLRGGKVDKNFDQLLVDIAVASQGLNYLPVFEIPTVIRTQNEYNLEEMIKKAANHEVEEMKGFTSAAHTVYNNALVQILYSNVPGISVDTLSANMGENEYLIPPNTQVKYTGYKIIDGKHVFTAEGVSVQLNKKHEISAYSKIKSEIDSLVQKTIIQPVTEDALAMLLKETMNINIKHGKMTDKEKATYFHKDANLELSNFEKDIASLKKINNNPEELGDALKKIAIRMRTDRDKDINTNDKEELWELAKIASQDKHTSVKTLTNALVKEYIKGSNRELLVEKLKAVTLDSDNKFICVHLSKEHPKILQDTLKKLSNQELLKVQSIYPSSAYINKKIEDRTSIIKNIFKSISHLDLKYINDALSFRDEIKKISTSINKKMKIPSTDDNKAIQATKKTNHKTQHQSTRV